MPSGKPRTPDQRKALEVTWEQFRESILAGWTDCMPMAHMDAWTAWQHLLAGGEHFQPPDDEPYPPLSYYEDARAEWNTMGEQ